MRIMSFRNMGLAFFLLGSLEFTLQSSPIVLANLEYSNPQLRSLRDQVQKNLKATRSRSDQDLPSPLVFYTYTVGKKDGFFQIMAKTGMNLDTLSSVNRLASPHDIYPGQKMLIPNMRGVYSSIDGQSNDPGLREKIAKEFGTSPEKLLFDPDRRQWFVPGGELKGREKMFFYGMAFAKPLLESRLTSQYGKRLDPFTNKSTFHGGIDLAAPEGTPVYASADGVVSFLGERGGYGNLIVLQHDLGYETRYGHLSGFPKKVSGGKLETGTAVRKGELIGHVGHTGRATGNHLHFEVRRFSKHERPVLR